MKGQSQRAILRLLAARGWPSNACRVEKSSNCSRLCRGWMGPIFLRELRCARGYRWALEAAHRADDRQSLRAAPLGELFRGRACSSASTPAPVGAITHVRTAGAHAKIRRGRWRKPLELAQLVERYGVNVVGCTRTRQRHFHATMVEVPAACRSVETVSAGAHVDVAAPRRAGRARSAELDLRLLDTALLAAREDRPRLRSGSSRVATGGRVGADRARDAKRNPRMTSTMSALPPA